MECLKISENEFKVSLKAEEAILYSVNDIKHGKRASAIREILVYAGKKYGFDLKDTKIFVEMFTVKSGDCEIFVRKTKNIKRINEGRRYIYRFDERNSFLMFLKKTFKETGNEITVYNNHGKEFYVISEISIPYYIEFFANAESEDKFLYINEHCSVLSCKTLELLSELG